MGIKTREYGYGKQVRGFSVSGKDRLKLETSLNIHQPFINCLFRSIDH